MTDLRLSNIVKRFDDTTVVDGVDFNVPSGTLTVLLGPSGCGKSTILRLISGIEPITAGNIFIGGNDVTREAASDRGVSMVFQSYALFPHLTVQENIEFGLRARKVPKATRAAQSAEAAELVGLDGLAQRKPSELSGGQRQRVAVARAIVADRPVCVMDEPLSNLDAKLRTTMRTEIRDLQQRLGLTMVYVTHDQTEAMTMADQLIVMNDGQIEQAGTPRELYDRPATAFVANFLGDPPMNLITSSTLGCRCAQVGIRPEHVRVEPPGSTPVSGLEGLEATVVAVEDLGADTIVRGEVNGEPLIARIAGQCPVPTGEKAAFSWPESCLRHFDADGFGMADGSCITHNRERNKQ